MNSDNDIESYWMDVRPVRLPQAEPEVPESPKEPWHPYPFNSLRILLNAAGSHGCNCRSGFTSLEGDLGFRCACGMVFRIGIADARRTAGGLLSYMHTTESRTRTALRLTYDPRQILIELENLRE